MKHTDIVKEFRGMSADDLAKKCSEFENELMNLRFRHSSGQLDNSAEITTVRRKIARAQTVLAEMSNEAAA